MQVASGVAITESVAHEAQGTRETFVLAVRLALDRVRELVARGSMPRGRPEVDSANELLASFESLGAMTELPKDEPALEPAHRARPASRAARERAPLLPDVRVPSGAIWPAVDGRLILHEAVSSDLCARRSDRRAWVAGTGTGWRIHSYADASYTEFDSAREAIVIWARVHAPRLDLLSPGRCIVVADSGDGAWRLWQIVRVAPSLRRWLLDIADGSAPGMLLDALSLAARTLFEGSIHPQSAGVPMTFETIGRGEQGAQIVSLMPGPGSRFDSARIVEPKVARRNVHHQLEVLLNTDFWDRLHDLQSALRDGSSPGVPDEWRQSVTAAIEAAAAH